MAALHGKKGSATFTGVTFEIISFSVDAVADTAEATVMDAQAVAASTHWKTHAAGFKDWTASCECLLPAAGVGLSVLGTSATLTLNTDVAAGGGRKYSGTAICTGVSPSSDAQDVGKCSLTFQGNGQLSEAAA